MCQAFTKRHDAFPFVYLPTHQDPVRSVTLITKVQMNPPEGEGRNVQDHTVHKQWGYSNNNQGVRSVFIC